MVERHLGAGGTPAEMQLRQTASSKGRNWYGFEAAIFETTGGYLERAATPEHHLSMHIGPPVGARRRFDGVSKQFIQSVGDIVIVPAGCPAILEDDAGTTIVSANIKPSLMRLVAAELGVGERIFSVVPHMQIRDPQVEHIFWALKTELEDGEGADHLYANCLGVALAAHLVRRYTASPLPQPDRRFSKKQVQRAIDYIRENLDSDLSLLEIARASEVSVSHLKALFKESTGMAVHRFVIQSRVETALELLLNGRLSIAEVAARTGFSDQSHLSRCMRRVLGVSPGTVTASRHIAP
jgi:AraC family transcriptional regulator